MEERSKSWKVFGSGGLISRCVIMRPAGWIILCLAVMLWPVSSAAAAATTTALDCMECHSGGGPIEPEQYEKSAHKDMSCSECHQKGFEKEPHDGKAVDAPSCMECHEGVSSWDKAQEGMDASVHSGMDIELNCTTCHDPHHLVPSNTLLDSGKGLAALNRSCLNCHASGDAPGDYKERAALEELGRKHKRLSHAVMHLQRTACVACHTPENETSVHNIRIVKESISDCDKCHSMESMLPAKLEAFLKKKKGADSGWQNQSLYKAKTYLTGATRHRWLDWGTFLVLGIVLAGVGAHALLRWFFSYIRRTS